eukprot:8105926-Prorocentrum_lima.AAC.1
MSPSSLRTRCGGTRIGSFPSVGSAKRMGHTNNGFRPVHRRYRSKGLPRGPSGTQCRLLCLSVASSGV